MEDDDDLLGLPVYDDDAAAKEERAKRKAGGTWTQDKIRERFMAAKEERAKYAYAAIVPRPRVDPQEESPAGPMRHQLHVSLNGPQLASSANVISVKIIKSAVGYPLFVYGSVFVRDELDCKRISLFRRDRDKCQRIDSMTHPNETDIGNWFLKDSTLTSTSKVIRNRIVGELFTVDLTYAPAHRAVEVTIDVKICEVLRERKRPTGFIAQEWLPFNHKKEEHSEFHGKVTACIDGIPEDFILYDSKAAGCVIRVGDGGLLQLTRRILAVPIDEMVTFDIVSRDGAHSITYYPRLCGSSSPHIRVGSYMLELKLVWSALYSRDVDGLPRCLALQYV
ncbi:hypothetical protein EJB05_18958, partial [Eragrostis curvula]